MIAFVSTAVHPVTLAYLWQCLLSLEAEVNVFLSTAVHAMTFAYLWQYLLSLEAEMSALVSAAVHAVTFAYLWQGLLSLEAEVCTCSCSCSDHCWSKGSRDELALLSRVPAPCDSFLTCHAAHSCIMYHAHAPVSAGFV